MLQEIIEKAQKDDKDAMMELINRFDPLFKKYAMKLYYEDAYGEIILYFIELIKSFKLDKLVVQSDGVIVTYINTCIKNFYNKEVSRLIKARKEIVLSNLTDEQSYYTELRSTEIDKTNIFIEFGIDRLLTRNESYIIYCIYVEGYSTVEVARMMNKSRQSVNQSKQRALKKLRKYCKL